MFLHIYIFNLLYILLCTIFAMKIATVAGTAVNYDQTNKHVKWLFTANNLCECEVVLNDETSSC